MASSLREAPERLIATATQSLEGLTADMEVLEVVNWPATYMYAVLFTTYFHLKLDTCSHAYHIGCINADAKGIRSLDEIVFS